MPSTIRLRLDGRNPIEQPPFAGTTMAQLETTSVGATGYGSAPEAFVVADGQYRPSLGGELEVIVVGHRSGPWVVVEREALRNEIAVADRRAIDLEAVPGARVWRSVVAANHDATHR